MALSSSRILVNGDIGSHGDGTTGVVVTSATKTWVEGKLVVLTGDEYICEHEDHNSETVITTLIKTYAEGKLMCNISAVSSCGAGFIPPGDPDAVTQVTKTYAE